MNNFKKYYNRKTKQIEEIKHIYTTKYTDGEEQKMFQTKRMNKITEDELLKLYKEVR